MKRKKRSTRGRKLFDPDKIATAISQNLNRDLSTINQLYGGAGPWQQFFCEEQSKGLLKKYVPTTADMTGVEREAFDSFLETNERMGVVNAEFRPPRDLPLGQLSPHERLLVRARALMHWVLGDVTVSELFEHCQNSGGVSVGVSFEDTSPEAKFTFPISGTAAAIDLFQLYASYNKGLWDAILEENRHQPMAEAFEEVDGSRATTVPKSASKLRMIAIEPTLNMYFQQGAMRVMYKRMRTAGLDVARLPTTHKSLAWEGSITGRKATIDFSSASDSVSIELLRWLLPKKWFTYIDLVRSPLMRIGGETVSLNMVSTMGNAGTFPLETLVFWTLGVAVVMQNERSNPYSLLSLPEERDKVSVFGDDCILPTEHAVDFMSTCEALGFQVNQEKSFFDPGGRFRESCGGDYLRGSDVRPLFIEGPTSNRMSALEPWLYVILNGVLKKYYLYFGANRYVYDKALLEYLFGLFRKHKLKVKLVPSDLPDDAGLKTYDWRRIRECYGIKYDTIARSDRGCWEVRYCRFQYRDQRKRSERLRYQLWLTQSNLRPGSERDSDDPIRVSYTWRLGKKIPEAPQVTFPRRRRGGYVVARHRFHEWR